MTTQQPEPRAPSPPQPIRRGRAVVIGACVIALVAAITASVVKSPGLAGQGSSVAAGGAFPIGTFSHHPVVITVPSRPASYLGAYVKGVPGNYGPVETLGKVTGVRSNIALYYSGWYEKFQSAFAIQAVHHGALPIVQIDPTGVSFPAITAGAYDTYLERFATQVASYGAKTHQGVVIGFGHEMNGQWFPWGYRHTSPVMFVSAWRHIVNVFRQQGAYDVAWLWTVNIIDTRNGIASPGPWWPGSSYVTWVGIDGYYYKPTWTFASLFGPTIKAVRTLTLDPILIAETAAAPSGQPTRIEDLFAGVRAYGLLGFVWFDAFHKLDWRITTPAAIAAFRREGQAYERAAP